MEMKTSEDTEYEEINLKETKMEERNLIITCWTYGEIDISVKLNEKEIIGLQNILKSALKDIYTVKRIIIPRKVIK